MVGPLWELVCEKLVHDYPHDFTRCIPEVSHLSSSDLEEAVKKNLVVDYRRRGSHYEATTVSQVKEICDKVKYCIVLRTSFLRESSLICHGGCHWLDAGLGKACVMI